MRMRMRFWIRIRIRIRIRIKKSGVDISVKRSCPYVEKATLPFWIYLYARRIYKDLVVETISVTHTLKLLKK